MANNAIPRDFVKNVMQNGVGRYVCQLKRITLRFCKSNPRSRHMREFVENHLLEFSQKNPGVVCYLQPRRHRPPSLVAEYLNGRREVMETTGMEPSEICKWVEHLRTRSGVQIVNMIQLNHTDTPSTQGIWHPFMFRDPEEATLEYPNQKLSQVQRFGKTATDLILEELREKQNELASSQSSSSIEDK